MNIALVEFNDRKIKGSVPAGHVKSFQADVKSHHATLLQKRDKLEKSQCRDARLFRRRVPDDELTACEQELVKGGLTLKGWKHLVHVYGGDDDKKEKNDKKDKKDKKDKTNK